MPDAISRPLPNTYWAEPGILLAGEYPGDLFPQQAERKLRVLLTAGVRVFINVTHPDDDLTPYADTLDRLAAEMNMKAEHLPFPIPDMSVPDLGSTMTAVLDAIDNAASNGQLPYIHCWGGIGRTGLVVGCYLVRHGLEPDEALREVQRRYSAMEKRRYHPYSPQSKEQFEYVRNWATLDES